MVLLFLLLLLLFLFLLFCLVVAVGVAVVVVVVSLFVFVGYLGPAKGHPSHNPAKKCQPSPPNNNNNQRQQHQQQQNKPRMSSKSLEQKSLMKNLVLFLFSFFFGGVDGGELYKGKQRETTNTNTDFPVLSKFRKRNSPRKLDFVFLVDYLYRPPPKKKNQKTKKNPIQSKLLFVSKLQFGSEPALGRLLLFYEFLIKFERSLLRLLSGDLFLLSLKASSSSFSVYF